MKKLFFSIITLALAATMTSLVSSCGGNDFFDEDDLTEPTYVTVDFFTAATDSQMVALDETFDFVYTTATGEVKKTISISDMTVSSNSSIESQLQGYNPKIYKISFTVLEGSVVYMKKRTFSVKQCNYKSDDKINVCDVEYFEKGGEAMYSTSNNVLYNKNLAVKDLASWTEQCESVSCSCKTKF